MTGTVSRRSILLGASATALGLELFGSACRQREREKRKGTIIGPGRFVDTRTGQMSFVLCLFDLDHEASRTVDMTFFGHGLAVHPQEPWRAVMFEKKGPGACELDLRAGRVVRPVTTPKSRAFYGHGAYSRDGMLLFATENELDTREGLVAVRDASRLRELGRFPTYGKSPHDCRLIDEGRTLAITNGGGTIDEDAPPSVTFVDVQSEKLQEKLVFGTPRINAGHLALTRSRDLVTSSAPRDGLPKTDLGGVTMRVGGGPFVTMSKPDDVIARMVGESLSLCIEEKTGVVGVTNPDGNIVTFWDLSQKRFVKKLDLPAPRGITQTVDGEYLVLSYGAGTVTLLDPLRLEPIPAKRVEKSMLSGSHIVAWEDTRA
jgi:uncharacterized protein